MKNRTTDIPFSTVIVTRHTRSKLEKMSIEELTNQYDFLHHLKVNDLSSHEAILKKLCFFYLFGSIGCLAFSILILNLIEFGLIHFFNDFRIVLLTILLVAVLMVFLSIRLISFGTFGLKKYIERRKDN